MPVVIGGLYNGKDKPQTGKDLVRNGKVQRRGFVSRRGHRAILFDDASKSGIALMTGNNKLKISLKETGTVINIFSDGKIQIVASETIQLIANQDVTIESGGTLTLKGTTGVKIESDAVVDIDGSIIQLN